ncbi:MAG: adenylate kinase [Pseudomonadota bacterium]
MRIALLGAPGSGKGTQAKMLAERYRVPHISTGDLLRAAVAKDRKFGKGVRAAMDAGELVTDEVVLQLLEERLRDKDTKRGFIIDGFPRNIPQAQALDTLLGMLGRGLQVVVNVAVDEDILVKRITGRLNCDECGAIFNKHFSPTKTRGKCDVCGARKLSARADDTNEKAVALRVQIYNENTAPLITYYKAQHKLRTVNSMLGIEEVHGIICEIVDLEIRPLEIKFVETAVDSMDDEESTIIAGGKITKISSTEKKPSKKRVRASAKTATTSRGKKKPAAKTTRKKPAAKSPSKTEKVSAAKVPKKKSGAKKSTAAAKPSSSKTTKKKVAKKSASKKKVVVKKKATAKKKAVAKKAVTKKKATPQKKTVAKKKAVAKKKTPAKPKSAHKKSAKKKAVTKKVGKKKSAARKSRK